MIVKPPRNFGALVVTKKSSVCGGREPGAVTWEHYWLAVTRCPRPQQSPQTNYIITSGSSFHTEFGSSLRSDSACAFFARKHEMKTTAVRKLAVSS